jgi:predicted N-acetyltransferase YhbS
MVSFSSRASSYIWPNRAADPTKANILEETFPFFSNLWSGSRECNWYLDMLATHPDFQGQGIGKELVNWGVEEADKENVCASVISAGGKEGFYGKFGFIEKGRANVGPLKENGIQGGAVMFRDVNPDQEAAVEGEFQARNSLGGR